MKRALLLCALMFPIAAQAQWTHQGTIPADTLKGIGGNGFHGVAVDREGKVWIQPFAAPAGSFIEYADSVFRYAVKVKRIAATQIFVYNPDGTPAPFSPITTLRQGGQTVDTLGVYRIGTDAATGLPRYGTLTGRGLRAGADGNIYVSQGGYLYRLDHRNGDLMSKVAPYDPETPLAAPAVDAAGNVYVAAVVQAAGRPIKVYSADLSTVVDPSAVAAPAGFSRSFEVSRDALRIYWAGYTNNAVHLYKRQDEFSAFTQVPDTVLKGIASESMTIHPVTGHLWVSAGSPNDAPNRFPNFTTNYQAQTWYAFDQNAVATQERPTPLDSIKWTGGGAGRPRGLAFSPGGNTAYAVQFSQSEPAIRVFRKEGTSIEPTGEIPTAFAVVGNYPNPFQSTTTIEFALAAAGDVTLRVYDLLGREVATLVDGTLAADTYRVSFDGSGLSTGTYLFRLSAQGHTYTGKMTLVK